MNYGEFTVIGLEITAMPPSGSGETECSNVLNAKRKRSMFFRSALCRLVRLFGRRLRRAILRVRRAPTC